MPLILTMPIMKFIEQRKNARRWLRPHPKAIGGALDSSVSGPETVVLHRDLANAARFVAVDAVQRAKSGYPGTALGMADVATVLFSRFLTFDPADPTWPNRDRLVISAGHGSMLLYALLFLTGFKDITLDELKAFQQWRAKALGRPDYGHMTDVEATIGPLGQGIGTAVGMSIAERLANARQGSDFVDHFTYVIADRGSLMEGLSQGAISLAGHLKLGRLIVLFDDHQISIDEPTSLACSDDQLARFSASGWSVRRVDGHDPEATARVLEEERSADLPSLVACRTVTAYSVPSRQVAEKIYGAPLCEEQIAAARAALRWPYPPFQIPDHIRAAWRTIGSRGHEVRTKWQMSARNLHVDNQRKIFETIRKTLPEAYVRAIASIRHRFTTSRPNIATRQASQQIIEEIAPTLPNLIGGSADLGRSNQMQGRGQKTIQANAFDGSYVHYGAREHGMAAAMNGIALYGNFIPYGETFLSFSDYSRPAIRLAALMGLRVIHILTHDSIDFDEDGPAYQPLEHLTSLRVVPNSLVFCPADAVETVEAWDCALHSKNRPSILCLSNQAVPTFRSDTHGANRVAMGAYPVTTQESSRDVTLIATGSEVVIALDAARLLASDHIRAVVVSAPCFALFAEQSAGYRAAVLGTAPRVGIELGVLGDWARWIGTDGEFVGVQSAEASAPGNTLHREFEITPQSVAAAARRSIQRGQSG